MLFIFGGLPGSGKSELASRLARERGAVYLRIDSIETAIKEHAGPVTGPEGYNVACRVAGDNLALGLSVVVDSVNPLERTRSAYRRVALSREISHREIEVVCSDLEEHRSRVENRPSSVEGLELPSWQAVRAREYEPWTGVDLVIDTAGETPEESFSKLLRGLGESRSYSCTDP